MTWVSSKFSECALRRTPNSHLRAANQRPIAARSASVIRVMLPGGMTLSSTACLWISAARSDELQTFRRWVEWTNALVAATSGRRACRHMEIGCLARWHADRAVCGHRFASRNEVAGGSERHAGSTPLIPADRAGRAGQGARAPAAGASGWLMSVTNAVVRHPAPFAVRTSARRVTAWSRAGGACGGSA